MKQLDTKITKKNLKRKKYIQMPHLEFLKNKF